MIPLNAVQLLARRAATFAGSWTAVEREIYDDQSKRVVVAQNAAIASYLASIHNAFLPLANGLLLAGRALRDRSAMTKLMEK